MSGKDWDYRIIDSLEQRDRKIIILMILLTEIKLYALTVLDIKFSPLPCMYYRVERKKGC